MKFKSTKFIALLASAILLPLAVQADVNVIIGQPAIAPAVVVAPVRPAVVVAPPPVVVVKPRPTVVVIGSRDHRGYYWDGRYWRSPNYWNAHYHYKHGKWQDKNSKHDHKYH